MAQANANLNLNNTSNTFKIPITKGTTEITVTMNNKKEKTSKSKKNYSFATNMFKNIANSVPNHSIYDGYVIVDGLNSININLKNESNLPSILELNFDNHIYDLDNIDKIANTMLDIYNTCIPATLDQLANYYNIDYNIIRDDLAKYFDTIYKKMILSIQTNLNSSLAKSTMLAHNTNNGIAKTKLVTDFIKNESLNRRINAFPDKGKKTLEDLETLIINLNNNRQNNIINKKISNIDMSLLFGFNTNNFDAYKSKIRNRLIREKKICKYEDECAIKYTEIEKYYLDDEKLNDIKENRILTRSDIIYLRSMGITLKKDLFNVKDYNNPLLRELIIGLKNLCP